MLFGVVTKNRMVRENRRQGPSVDGFSFLEMNQRRRLIVKHHRFTHLRRNDDPGKDEDYIAPTNETESVLAEIWKEHLNIERVGIRDLFFSLGGHSLLMTPIASSIAKRLDVYITFQALFENPTIEELAAYIVNLKNATPGEAENDDNIERFIYEK